MEINYEYSSNTCVSSSQRREIFFCCELKKKFITWIRPHATAPFNSTLFISHSRKMKNDIWMKMKGFLIIIDNQNGWGQRAKKSENKNRNKNALRLLTPNWASLKSKKSIPYSLCNVKCCLIPRACIHVHHSSFFFYPQSIVR
jgi:hypothetical protein